MYSGSCKCESGVSSRTPEEYRVCFMTQGQLSGSEDRRITRSARRKAISSVAPTVLAREFTIGGEETHYVTQADEIVSPVLEYSGPVSPPDSDTAIKSGEEEMDGGRLMDAVRRAPLTRLKYNRFKGDRETDVDDWLDEFTATAQANQEDAESRLRVFSGLLKGEALKWYLDTPEDVREDWGRLTGAFLRTFREPGGEARALGRLSTMRMSKTESVRKYGQRVKSLIQKLTTEIAPSVQVEWYVAGFPKDMGLYIRQSRPGNLREAMEAAQNYENSAQSLRKSLKRSDAKGGRSQKQKERDRKKKKMLDTDSSEQHSSTDTTSEGSEGSDTDTDSRSVKNQNTRASRSGGDKGSKRVKEEYEDALRSIKDSLEAIRVNLAGNPLPRKLIPTSRSNVWCARCREHGHYAGECTHPQTRRAVQFVDPDTGVYYTLPDEELEEEVQPTYQIQPGYGRGRGQPSRAQNISPGRYSGIGSGSTPTGHPAGYSDRIIYCYKCGGPGHYANNCPMPTPLPGGMLTLPCQNCEKYGHHATSCPEAPRPKVLVNTVEIPPRGQTGLNYGHTAGVENPDK